MMKFSDKYCGMVLYMVRLFIVLFIVNLLMLLLGKKMGEMIKLLVVKVVGLFKFRVVLLCFLLSKLFLSILNILLFSRWLVSRFLLLCFSVIILKFSLGIGY